MRVCMRYSSVLLYVDVKVLFRVRECEDTYTKHDFYIHTQ